MKQYDEAYSSLKTLLTNFINDNKNSLLKKFSVFGKSELTHAQELLAKINKMPTSGGDIDPLMYAVCKTQDDAYHDNAAFIATKLSTWIMQVAEVSDAQLKKTGEGIVIANLLALTKPLKLTGGIEMKQVS